jgi:hypothetical protein
MAIAAAVILVSSITLAQEPPVNVARGGLAVHGYDVVAYFTDGAAVKGRPEFEHRWDNAVWRFASAAHRDEFARHPQRYAPQFGGYCAWAVSRGYTADIDPESWRVVDGRLYLNYSTRAQRMWEADIRGNIRKGEANWPGVLGR